MKIMCFVSLLVLCSLLSSCANLPEVTVKTTNFGVNSKIQPTKVIIVSDVGKRFGKSLKESFNHTIESLVQASDYDVSFMTFIEYIRSAYNEPDNSDEFSDTLFVFVEEKASDTIEQSLLLTVRYLEQDTLLSQIITIKVRRYAFDSKLEGSELGSAIFKELQSRNIL